MVRPLAQIVIGSAAPGRAHRATFEDQGRAGRRLRRRGASPLRVSAVFGLALIAASTRAAEPEGGRVDLRSVVARNADVSSDPARGFHQDGPLELRFRPAEWPSVTFKAPKAWDWSRAGRLLVALKNPGAERLEFGIRVDDDPAADGTVHCRTAESVIGPGESATFAVEFGREPMSYGMRGLPGSAGVRSLATTGTGSFNLGHIVGFQLYLHRPKLPRSLVLNQVSLAPAMSLEGIVDRFGQYTRAEWPGKLPRDDALIQRRELEQAELKAHPALPDRDRFGGWRDGPRLRASGSFRTEKVGPTWWLVDPDGRLFFSSGLDEVRIDFPTIVTGREAMFTWLPDPDDPLARFLGSTQSQRVHSGPVKVGRTFDFYQANLARKYGRRFSEEWKEVTLRRMSSWGFNTFGNWSDRFIRNGRIPYVASAGIRGDHARVSSGSDFWGKMHDPFDPRFAASVEQSLREVISEVKRDPWCLGYFVDNELSWGDSRSEGAASRYGLALGTLEETGDAPAKRALLAQLKRKYGAVDRLNASWGTEFAGWPALEASWKPSLPLNKQLEADLSRFVSQFARTYFQTVRDQIKKEDPGHLYLGCRFAQFTPEAVEAAAEHCDVVSFNIYEPRISAKEWDFLNDLKRPCLIGEFHVGAVDRGMFSPGLVAAPDQAARAAAFEGYVGSVLDHPAIVGCHWFQYVDEPLTGRTFDGENYAIGFVSVTDTPYPELVAAARSIHREVYSRRYKGK